MNGAIPRLVVFVLVILLSGCTQSRGKLVEFDDLVSNPQKYHGKKLCTEGVYVSGFETSALGASIYRESSGVYLTEPTIWIERPDIKSSTGCFETDTAPPAEFCQVTVCGLFEVGDSYGHGGAYKFQIRGDG